MELAMRDYQETFEVPDRVCNTREQDREELASGRDARYAVLDLRPESGDLPADVDGAEVVDAIGSCMRPQRACRA